MVKKHNLVIIIALAAISVIIIGIVFSSGVIADAIIADLGPRTYEYKGAIITSKLSASKTVYHIGEEVEITPELINIGKENITISHGDPAFIIDVYSPLGFKAWSYQFPQLLVAHITELNPNIPYRWDEDIMKERYDIRLFLPGQYRFVAHTDFVVEEAGKGELEKGTVYSSPMTITIVP